MTGSVANANYLTYNELAGSLENMTVQVCKTYASLGSFEGTSDGELEGNRLGASLGSFEGTLDGDVVGKSLGALDSVGADETEGCCVGAPVAGALVGGQKKDYTRNKSFTMYT